MAANDTASMALFCDFENVALGVRDAQYEKFDIRPVLERLLAKGSIVVKKAYCDWDRYKGFKSAMHEANFELIEIPHVRQSGKNSADIRMVVDALDLCYTKAHVDTFVIISGDSDFSPLVSKLRENAKRVIGVGVKQSCSDLLVTNCDEFIYYDDLVRDREAGRSGPRREREKRSPEEEARRSEKMEARQSKAIDLVAATFADLMADRGEAERVWASVLKEVMKRRNPGFSESYFGFRTFGNLLDEAAARGLLAVGRDEKSGTFVTRATLRPAEAETVTIEAPLAVDGVQGEISADDAPRGREEKGQSRRRGGRRGRQEVNEATESLDAEPVTGAADLAETEEAAQLPDLPLTPSVEAAQPQPLAEDKPGTRRRGGRGARRDKREAVPAVAAAELTQPAAPATAADVPVAAAVVEEIKPRSRGRSRRDRSSPVEAVETASPMPVASEPELAAAHADATPDRGSPPADKKETGRRTASGRRGKKTADEPSLVEAGVPDLARAPDPTPVMPADAVAKPPRAGRKPRQSGVSAASGEVLTGDSTGEPDAAGKKSTKRNPRPRKPKAGETAS